MARFNSVYGLTTNDINSSNFEELLLQTKEIAEEIPKKVEITTERNCRKKIYVLNLKKEKNDNTLSEKEKYISFVKNQVSKLLSQINKWAEIFESKKMD